MPGTRPIPRSSTRAKADAVVKVGATAGTAGSANDTAQAAAGQEMPSAAPSTHPSQPSSIGAALAWVSGKKKFATGLASGHATTRATSRVRKRRCRRGQTMADANVPSTQYRTRQPDLREIDITVAARARAALRRELVATVCPGCVGQNAYFPINGQKWESCGRQDRTASGRTPPPPGHGRSAPPFRRGPRAQLSHPTPRGPRGPPSPARTGRRSPRAPSSSGRRAAARSRSATSRAAPAPRAPRSAPGRPSGSPSRA